MVQRSSIAAPAGAGDQGRVAKGKAAGDRTEAWLSLGFCLARLARPNTAMVERCAPWVAQVVSEAPALPPAGMIVDLGLLLTGRALSAAGGPVLEEHRLQAALSRYEEHVLGRLAADRRLEAATDAMARLPVRHEAAAVALFVEHVFTNLGFGSGQPLRPGLARRHLGRPPEEVLARGLTDLRHAAGTEVSAQLEALAGAYEALSRQARHARGLLGDKLLFTLENLAVLRGRTQRLASEQMVDVAERFDRELPRRLRRLLRRRGNVQTKVEDESHYPIGGFTAISTAGSLENLVSSELVYMDPPAASGGRGDSIDLFDVRYAEGELLYYTRDESAFSRNRRRIVFALLPDLTAARFKDAALPAQRLVLAFGLLLCIVRRLADALREEALELALVFVADEGGVQPLDEERELATLLLREWIDKGVASVETAASLQDVLEAAKVGTRRAEVDLVTVGCSLPRLSPPQLRPILLNRLSLEQAEPELLAATPQGGARETGEPWQRWVDAARVLLQQLL